MVTSEAQIKFLFLFKSWVIIIGKKRRYNKKSENFISACFFVSTIYSLNKKEVVT